jgi:hypothetical protein
MVKEAPNPAANPLPPDHKPPSQVSNVVLGRSSSSHQRASKLVRVPVAKAEPSPNQTNQQTSACSDPQEGAWEGSQKGEWERLRCVKFYSYGATTDETQFPDYPPDRKSSERKLSAYFHDHGINFQRWIATDRILLKVSPRSLTFGMFPQEKRYPISQ